MYTLKGTSVGIYKILVYLKLVFLYNNVAYSPKVSTTEPAETAVAK
jgi:hypothetical protein